jgi:F-type H+-transporting ATPase subunit c
LYNYVGISVIFYELVNIKKLKMLSEFKMIGAGLATIALSGVGVGIGYIFGSLLDAISRNPSITRALFNYAILGFALTEAIALFTIMIVFLILY